MQRRWVTRTGVIGCATIASACAAIAGIEEPKERPETDAGATDGGPPIDGGEDSDDVAADAYAEVDGGCSQAAAALGLGGIGVPAGTVPSVSSTYGTVNTPDKAFDGNLSTNWESDGYQSWIRLSFPSPVRLDGVRIAAFASPTTTESYQITGYQGATSIVIGSATTSVPASPTVLAPIAVTAGAYDAIRVDVGGGASWVSISEISILTAACR
jgi:hypothetical protein